MIFAILCLAAAVLWVGYYVKRIARSFFFLNRNAMIVTRTLQEIRDRIAPRPGPAVRFEVTFGKVREKANPGSE